MSFLDKWIPGRIYVKRTKKIGNVHRLIQVTVDGKTYGDGYGKDGKTEEQAIRNIIAALRSAGKHEAANQLENQELGG